MFMLNSNKSIKGTHQLFKIERQSCDRNPKQFFQWKQEKVWSFDKARNVLFEKKNR